MSNLIWWIGAVHAAAYLLAGTAFAVTVAAVQAHRWAGVLGKMIVWHNARYRWNHRNRDGLSDAEWQRGEPRP